MFESKYSKLLTILLIVGIVLIVGILSVAGFLIIRNGKLKEEAGSAVDHFQGQVNETPEENVQENNVITNEVAPIIGVENIVINGNTSDETNTSNYKGFPMVGTMEIPAINLKYPILETASKSAIEVALAIYDGVGLNQVGNTTIVGHNYRNGTFFSNNKKLVEGDKVYITDTTGKKITYIIYKIYTTSPEDSSYLDRDTEGRREITLLTCTDDTQSRLVIWAKQQ